MPALLHAPARSFRNLLLLPALVLAMLGSLLVLGAPAAEARTTKEKVKIGMRIAVAQKGDPYRYGAAGPNAFDCSGLVYYSFRRAGFNNVPRTSDAQAAAYRGIKRRNMRRGDFVYFHRGGDVYHVGIFAGRKNGQPYVLHAPYGSQSVHRERIWTNSWFGGTLRH